MTGAATTGAATTGMGLLTANPFGAATTAPLR
jgi:hypothetical protein